MANEFVVKNGLISPNVQLQGSTSGSVTIAAPAVAGTTSITLPSTAGTLVTTGDTGTVTNTMLAGSIANAKLVNSAVTVGSTSISLGASSTTLAGLTSVTSTSFVGALTGNASTATTLQTARTIALSGDVAGSVSFDGSANATISATIQPDSVALGTDTTGNYMVNVSAGTGVTVSHTPAEGSTATVSIGQAVGTTDNVTFNNVTVNGTLTSDDITSASISVAGNATITGNLTVSGTTTTINSTTIAIADLNLELARNATTATQANGAGITVTGPATAATLTYSSTDDRWNLNKNLNISRVYGTATNVSNVHTAGSYLTGGTFDGSAAVTWAVDATPSNTASKVVARDASGNFSAGTITAALAGNASTASSWQNARTLSYTGDVTGSMSVDGSVNVSTALTLAASGVTAGTYNNVTVNSKGLVTSGSNVAYLTSYSETDTLASVTARGATTSSQITVDSVITTNNGNGTNIRLGDDVWIGDVNLANTFRIRGNQDAAQGYITFGSDNTQFGRNGTGALTWGGNTVWHAGNLTNLNQLTNGPGYITGYTETDTLASVTGRGFTSRASSGTFATATQGTPGLEIYGGGTTEPAYMTFHRPGVYAVRFGLDGSDLKVGGWSMGAVSYKMWHEGNLTNLNQLTNGPGYISSESDTLATVTSRGATTSTALTLSGTVTINAQTVIGTTSGTYVTPSSLHVGSKNTGSAVSQLSFESFGAYTGAIAMNSSGNFSWGGQGSSNWYWKINNTYNGDYSSTGTSVASLSSGGSFVATGDVRAPIFYDYNDTAYYIDPNATPLSIKVAGNIELTARSASWAEGIRINVPSSSTWGGIRWTRGSSTGNWALGYTALDSSDDISFYSGTTTSIRVRLDHSANLWAYGSMRSPIFYDNDNTAYYVDPAGTSNLNGLTLGGLTYSTESRRSKNSSNVDIETVSGLVTPTTSFFEVRGFCPPTMYRTTGDRPAPYGIGFGNGSESGGIMPVGSGDYLQEIMLYGANSGPTTFHFRRQLWEAGTYDAAYSNYYSSSRFYINTDTGESGAPFQFRSPIFYDYNDTTYYLDGAGTSYLYDINTRFINFRSHFDHYGIGYWYRNDTSSFIQTFNTSASSASQFNMRHSYGDTIIEAQRGGLYVYGSLTQANNSLRAPIFYDSNDTTYYLDPNSTGTSLYVAGVGRFGTYASMESASGGTGIFRGYQNNNHFIAVRGSVTGSTSSPSIGGAHQTTFVEHMSPADSSTGWFFKDSYNGAAYTYNTIFRISASDSWVKNYLTGESSLRAPIFYDSNDTGYYCDPNSTSNLNGLTLGGRNMRQFESNSFYEFYVGGDANTYYPVRLNVTAWMHWGRWSISRGYADTAPWDPIGTGAHRGGLTLTWEWSGDGAWGGNDHNVRVVEFTEQYTTMVAGLQLSVDGMIVWLRGGNAYYRLHGPGGMNNSVTVTYGTYTAANGATYAARAYGSNSNTVDIYERYPVRNSTELYDTNRKALYENGWINDKYFGTDGLIYANQSRPYIMYDRADSAYYLDPNSTSTSLNIAGGISTPMMWVNYSASNNNNYNEGIRLYSAANNAAVITFNTGGTTGSSYSSLIGYTDRFEQRWAGQWQERMYNGYSEAYGSYRAPIFYDSNDTGYYADPNGTSIFNSLTINGTLNAYANPVKINRINFTSTAGSQHSDPYCFRWVGENDTGGGSSWLELQMNDDDGEEFRIYGYSCQGYACGQLSSNLYHRFRATGYAWHAGNLETGGSITASGNVTAYSDERLKKDITTIENPLNKVMQLRGVNYTMIKDDSKSIGVVAQEIEKIIPEVVQTSEEGIKSVAYGNMVGLLIEAIKEQQKQIEELKGIINEIRG